MRVAVEMTLLLFLFSFLSFVGIYLAMARVRQHRARRRLHGLD